MSRRELNAKRNLRVRLTRAQEAERLEQEEIDRLLDTPLSAIVQQPKDPVDKEWERRDSPNTKAKPTDNQVQLDIPAALLFLLEPKRLKGAWGGRGSGKSWSFARCLIAIAHSRKVLILCAREYQNSIQDSVLRLLEAQIEMMGLTPWFDVQKTTIISKVTGAEFIFKGLHRNVLEIKSTEGVDYCWVEEAQTVSDESWQTLIPTIRKPGSEIWVSWNPLSDTDSTHKRFILNSPPNSIIRKVGWQDNHWFPAELEAERQYMLKIDPDAYDHVWEGGTRKISAATIYRGKFRVDSFKTPDHVERFFYGADFGFSQDPSTLVRFYIEDNKLYIDYEAYEVGCEIDDLEKLYDKVPGSRDWPIKADNSRPETISFVRRRGFLITAADKWPGSVEDGIEHIKGFDEIIVHERCVHTAMELRLYSYKVDKLSNDILPVIVDKHNHCMDPLRYGLDGYIQARGGVGIWHKLAQD